MASKTDWNDRLAVGDRVRHVTMGITGTLTREAYYTISGVRAVRVQWDGNIEPMLIAADHVVGASR